MKLKRTPNQKGHGQRGISLTVHGYPVIIVWENSNITFEGRGDITKFALELTLSLVNNFDTMYQQIGTKGMEI